MVNCILLSSGEPENLWGEALLLPVLYSIGFLKETPMLLPMNVEKGELLTFNSSKFGVIWLRSQYQSRRKEKSILRLLILSPLDMHWIAMLTDS